MTRIRTLLAALAAVVLSSTAPATPPNVLLICVDDLRCETGCYGVEGIRTPHIDRLAREGRMFSRHFVHAAACGPSRSAMLPYQRPKSADSEFPDTFNAEAAIGELDRLSKAEQPFFLAVGFYKPHLPFVAPQRHWDQYERDAIPPAPHPKPAAHTKAAISLHQSYEPTTHYHWPEGPGKVSAESGRALKHAYWAAVSYTDEQIGRVLDASRKLGLEKNTIVVLWSDHGWHLGDHGIWGKATHHEVSLRSPLVIKIPGQPMPGKAAGGLVESVDLYPTLADLCGLEVPQDLQGRSNAALVRNPSAPGKSHAIGIWKNGRSIRTDTHRYVEWKSKQGEVIQQELYDLQADPMETENVAGDHADLVSKMRNELAVALSKQN